jgi:hypothetical protein
MEQLMADINGAEIDALTDMELGVFTTPEGTTFVDGIQPHFLYGSRSLTSSEFF